MEGKEAGAERPCGSIAGRHGTVRSADHAACGTASRLVAEGGRTFNGIRARVGKEDYYTKPEVLEGIAKVVNKLVPEGRYFDFSAGDGRFAELLSADARQIDLHPRSPRVLERDFLTYPPESADVIGLNPPFGKQGTLAKRFVRRAEAWKARFMVLILPRLRGTFWVDDYRVVVSRPLPRNAFFRPSRPGRSVHVPTTLWVLERADAVAKISTYVRPDMATPEGFRIFPRTRQWNLEINLAIRMVGYGSGKSGLFKEKDGWRVVRMGKLAELVASPADAGWCLSVRKQGADFVLCSTTWSPADIWRFLQNLKEDPVAKQRQCESMRRSWLAKMAREFSI